MNVLVDETSLQGIANAIREKNGSEDIYKPSHMPQAILDIVSGGGIDLISYAQTLAFDARLSEVTEPITLHLENMARTHAIFDLIVLNTPKITVYLSETATSLFRFLRKGGSVADGLKELEIIGSTKNAINFSQFVSGRAGLERIIGEIDFSSSTDNSNMFDYCYALQQFTPKPNTIKTSISFSACPNLTDESIQAVVDGLSDLTGQTSQTLSVHSTVLAKIVTNTELYNVIRNKNWQVT